MSWISDPNVLKPVDATRAYRPLSSKLRPNSECAPWVLRQIRFLEDLLEEANSRARSLEYRLELAEKAASSNYDEIEKLRERPSNLNSLSRALHLESVNAGWWDDIERARGVLQPEAFTKYVGYVVGTKVGLIHSEVSEALEGFRKNANDDHLPHRLAVEVELADAIIRVLDLAGYLKLDIDGALSEKRIYNRDRADHKPEARAAEGGKRF